MIPDSPIPFEEFMARALHDPQRGYYARNISGVGRNGDFTTTPMLSAAPASAIAKWALQAMRECGCRDLIEIGPGEGILAADVLRNLPWHIRWHTRLHLVETSLPLAKRQQALLGKQVCYHRNMAEALDACHGKAIIWSNELVDAFPVRRFQKTDTIWQELAVQRLPTGKIAESLLPPSSLPASSVFLDEHPPGQYVEVHDTYRRYLENWLPRWKAGRLLTIDYGAVTEKLYLRRPRGTLRAYLFQQRLEGTQVYDNPGRQDLTADVNFTDLQQWSQPWTTAGNLMHLRDFLSRWTTTSLQNQLWNEPEGAGDAFLALDQKCNAPQK